MKINNATDCAQKLMKCFPFTFTIFTRVYDLGPGLALVLATWSLALIKVD